MSNGKKDKNEKRIASGTFRDKLGAAIGVAVPAQAQKAADVKRLKCHSAQIQGGKDRAGRAPYNFVPLAEGVVSDLPGPPPLDSYDEKSGISGEIDLRITALTHFYIRGMWRSFEEHLRKQREPRKEGERPPLPLDSFQVNSKLRLPGSSLRGMIRSLVEILAKAPLEPVNDTQLFFRAVGASAKPGDRSFDPNAISYRSRLVEGDGTKMLPTFPKAQAGYLYGSHAQWSVRPAEIGPKGTQWYRVPEDSKLPPRDKKVEFLPATAECGHYPHRTEVFYKFGIVGKSDWHEDIRKRPDHCLGRIIRSGLIKGKYLQWIIHEEDTSAKPLIVPPKDVEDYKNDKNSNVPRGMEYTDQSKGAPCFYIQWKDPRGAAHVSFGHTPYFRLPYQTTPQMAIPPRKTTDPNGWDLGQLLFGRVHKNPGQSARGRVFFEDALPIELMGVDTAITKVVLGEPKPTTYQHYLVQHYVDGKESIHWDAPGATLRGHKLYWHRPGADPTPSADLLKKEKVLTSFHKANANNVFVARVRFENLSRLELGLLLTAIQLPVDCRHRLGMAKPLGFGSLHIKVTAFRQIFRHARYKQWFDSSTRVYTGKDSEESSALAQECRKTFAEWYLGQQDLDAISFEEALWSEPRLGELRAMLSWKDFQSEEQRKRWLGRTRYMGFGEVMKDARWGDSHSWIKLNEYRESGYPERQPELAPRRPLPPASQVANLSDRNVPEDSTPPWIPQDELKKLREKRTIAEQGSPRRTAASKPS